MTCILPLTLIRILLYYVGGVEGRLVVALCDFGICPAPRRPPNAASPRRSASSHRGSSPSSQVLHREVATCVSDSAARRCFRLQETMLGSLTHSSSLVVMISLVISEGEGVSPLERSPLKKRSGQKPRGSQEAPAAVNKQGTSVFLPGAVCCSDDEKFLSSVTLSFPLFGRKVS